MASKELAATDPNQPTYIVGLGASAGGLEALEAFFSEMPVDTGMAFVVIQHLAPDFKSLMDELLTRRTSMTIHKSENNMKIEPNSIYLIPPKKEMIVEDGALLLRDRNTSHAIPNLPIDIFFESLAHEYKNKAIAIIFSGTGSDGSRGIAAIHEEGGLVMCQRPESASFDGMPNSAIATNLVDVVVNPSEMPNVLVEYLSHSQNFLDSHKQIAADTGLHIYSPIFKKLRDEFDVDFQYYKPATIGRRIERRMSLNRNLTVDDYIAYLNADNNEELKMLYRDLLIGVTQFFRDEHIWEYLEHEIIPSICESCSLTQEVRFWVPGCATGEEAYSIAILIHEYLIKHNKPTNVRLFATDLHKDSLVIAGKGQYSASALAAIPTERRNQYFSRVDEDLYEVKSEIRRMVVFAQHNLLKDPPFTKIDFISCRNLLIYFMVEAQKRSISILHFALRVGGVLFLGPSESLGDISNEFEELNRRYKIFKKRRDIKLNTHITNVPNPIISSGNITLKEGGSLRTGSIGGRDINLIRAYDVLLQTYVPPSLLVEQNGTLAHTFGEATDYLRTPKGVSSLNILDIIHSDLRMAVSTGMQRSNKDSTMLSYGGIKVDLSDTGEDIRVLRVTIKPLSERAPSDYVLITLEETQLQANNVIDNPIKVIDEQAAVIETNPHQLSSQHVRQLEEELSYTKENLQATVEELETSNEELQATNEELMASNEELQSTNEELHSVNEELYTVNREYEEKIEELTQVNDDMDNLLAATEIGTIFLDQNLKIRKFTPSAARQFSLISQDIGRPISHLNRNIEFDDFQKELENVKRTGVASTFEVRNIDYRWYLMGLHPYQKEQKETNGVVITFVEITLIKEVSTQVSQRNEDLQSFAYAISHDLNEPVRLITTFSELLVNATKLHEDKKVMQMVEQMKSASSQLKQMLSGTLRFSRIMTQGQPFERHSLMDCLDNAKADLSRTIKDNKATITCEKLPSINCDINQLSRAFLELISNSIKFKKPDEDPVITINYTETSKDYLVTYSDNGIGIQVDKPERIFNIFFCAGGKPKQENMGLGLAICKRIIERHQGSINFVASDNGSQFLIQLPIPVTVQNENQTDVYLP